MGTAWQLQQSRLWTAEAYAVCVLLALAGWGVCGVLVRRHTAWRWVLAGVVALCAALASFGQIGLRSAAFAATALAPELEGRDLLIEGTIAAMPQWRENGWRFRMAVDKATADGRDVPVPPLMDLSWYAHGLFGSGHDGADDAIPELVAGERWSLQVRLKAPHGGFNPHGFDYELWMWEQGVQATGYVRARPHADASGPRRMASTWSYPVERLRQHVRDAIVDRWGAPSGNADALRMRAAGVVAALVTGDQRAIGRRDWETFRITGVAHLMSISGLHITMFAWLANALVVRVWRRSGALCLRVPAQVAGMVCGVLLAACYALFSGWGVPAQRTIFMLVVVALLRLCGRRWPWPHVWLLACALVLLWDPWALLQAGFWLSFVAVGILFASHVAAPVRAPQDGASARGVVARLGATHLLPMLRQQWLMTLALAPLTLVLFGQISLVGLVTNFWAIPWVTLVAVPLAFLGIVWNDVWVLALWSVQWLLWGLQWCAALPLSHVSMAMAPLWAGVVAVMGGIWLGLRLPWLLRLWALPCLLPALWWSPARPTEGHVELLAMDVGQGQAVLVRTARHSLLYDAGPQYSADTDAGERVVVPLLRALDERVDLLMLSHRDADHTGGASAVLAQQPQAQLMASVEATHRLWQARPWWPCTAGHTWRWDGVQFTVLHPRATAVAALADGASIEQRSNAMSCVLLITDAHGVSALLAGDIEQAQERDLLARGLLRPVNYLLMPHHGSKTSSSEAFLDAVKPTLAVVQAGYRNRFGHPAPDVMARYRERHIPVLSTPACGAAWWRSVRPAQWVCEREQSARYWNHLEANSDH